MSCDLTLSLDKARARVQVLAPHPRSRFESLWAADDRVLLAPVLAMRDQPPFPASAMDGYAISGRDQAGEGRVLRLIGESRAGQGYPGEVGPGQAVRIFTGAPVPLGTDAVIMQEHVHASGDGVQLLDEGLRHPESFVRPQGLDFRVGDILIPAGTRLKPAHLALAAAAGAARLEIARKPRIAVLATGAELVMPGRLPGPDQVYEASGAALMAMGRRWGAKMRWAGLVTDRLRAITDNIAALTPDLIVTIGGASVGDHDLVHRALERLGFEAEFTRIELRPGRPTGFGQIRGGAQVLILPGNPVSTQVAATLILKPWIEAALGQAVETLTETGILSAALGGNGRRESYLRARLAPGSDGLTRLSLCGTQDSSVTAALASAQALIRRPADSPPLPAGARVEFLRL